MLRFSFDLTLDGPDGLDGPDDGEPRSWYSAAADTPDTLVARAARAHTAAAVTAAYDVVAAAYNAINAADDAPKRVALVDALIIYAAAVTDDDAALAALAALEDPSADCTWYTTAAHCASALAAHAALARILAAAYAAAPSRCQCGDITDVQCEWAGPLNETVLVEWVPERLREAHLAPGNAGLSPYAGAQRRRCRRYCADKVRIESDGWARII